MTGKDLTRLAAALLLGAALAFPAGIWVAGQRKTDDPPVRGPRAPLREVFSPNVRDDPYVVDQLRRQVEALEETLGFTATKGGAPADAAAVLLLADSIRRRRRLRTAYRTFSGDESERELSPHGLVVHSGRWYLAAHDHTRDDLRTFRVDRMWRTTLTEAAALPPPDGFDAVAHVTRSLASVPWEWEVEVLLDLPVDEAARRIPATLAELVEVPEGTLLRMRVGSLDWMATVLAGLGCSFTIRRPHELRTSVRTLAAQLEAAAG